MFFKRLRCGHQWEKVMMAEYYETPTNTMPYKRMLIWRCTKCGKVQKIKI